MKFNVITLFPLMVQSVVEYGVVRRAKELGVIHVECINPRDFTTDKHRTVDDRPFGGGPGMVMKADCLLPSINYARDLSPNAKVIYLSPQGKSFKQQDAVDLAKEDNLILLCGRYEGIDERVIKKAVDMEYSIGDYVLSGGELAAMVMIDAVTRLLPNVLGHSESADQDSFSTGLLDHPHYTRSTLLGNEGVPPVLKSGDHQVIAQWRQMQALGRTAERRPDLLQARELTKVELALLKQYKALK